MKKESKFNKNEEIVNEEPVVDETGTPEGGEQEQQGFEPGTYFWALDMVIRGVEVAQKSGVYTLDEASVLAQAIYIINNTNIKLD